MPGARRSRRGRYGTSERQAGPYRPGAAIIAEILGRPESRAPYSYPPIPPGTGFPSDGGRFAWYARFVVPLAQTEGVARAMMAALSVPGGRVPNA